MWYKDLLLECIGMRPSVVGDLTVAVHRQEYILFVRGIRLVFSASALPQGWRRLNWDLLGRPVWRRTPVLENHKF